MSGVLNLHADIARELFLDYMSQKRGNAHESARAAVEGADIFIEAYAKRGAIADEPVSPKRLKGCMACFGSGGKVGRPCKVCAGTGKVAE